MLFFSVPSMTDYDKIAKALEYIQVHRQEQPSLDEIAAEVHLSPFHFQRLFQSWAGVSPKKFLQYLSVEHAKELLQKNKASLLEATHQTGLSGTGRLHDLFVILEGMTPGEYKNHGKNLTISYSLQHSPFGPYLVASTEKGICNILFYDADASGVESELKNLWPKATMIHQEEESHRLVQKFFNRDLSQGQELSLHLKGTPFQLKVWEALLKIPEGQLMSYTSVGERIRQPSARRAVGSAIGQNPVGYLIPCHRVIQTIGHIGQYRWGRARKMAMIAWEGAHVEQARVH